MVDSLKGHGAGRDVGTSFRFDVGRETGPSKPETMDLSGDDLGGAVELFPTQQEQAAAQERLEISRQIALNEAEPTFSGNLREGEDPFAEPVPPPKAGVMQRLGKYAAGVMFFGNIARLVGGAIGGEMKTMEAHKEAARQSTETAAEVVFESRGMRVEKPEVLTPSQKEVAIHALETLVATMHVPDGMVVESAFPDGSFAHDVLQELSENGHNVEEAARTIEFSGSDVRGLADEMYGLTVEARTMGGIGAMEDLCGERVAEGPATTDTVHLDALKCFDVYGDANGGNLTGTPEGLKPLIAAGHDFTMEQLSMHRELVSQSILEESGSLTAHFYGQEDFPASRFVYSQDADAEMLHEAFDTTIEMASWSVKEAGMGQMSSTQREAYTEAFGDVVRGQVDAQHAWYGVGTTLEGARVSGDVGEANTGALADTALPNLLEKQTALEAAWTHLASFEDGQGVIHQAAEQNLSAEHAKAVAFNEHASQTGVLPNVWNQQKDALSASNGQLASRE